MNVITRSEQIRVAYDVDVCVVGGGPAGVAAAFQAARNGVSVLVIEQMNCLGGIATAGWHGHICSYDPHKDKPHRIVGGTCFDLVGLMLDNGYGTYDGYGLDFEVEYMKYQLERIAGTLPNLQVLYYTQFSDVIVEDGRVTHVIIQNKSGRQAVRTKMVIDCSGDADVAARAGVPYEKGRPGDGAMQPMTLMFQMGGFERESFMKFRTQGYMERYGVDYNDSDKELWKEAQANGDMEPFQTKTMGWWWCATRPDQIGANFTHIAGRDCTNTEDLTYATIEGRRQAYESIKVFRKYMPGMENVWMSHTGGLIGTRESRRIDGLYRITAEDVLGERYFDDSIGYGSFFIDIHNCTGAGMDAETYYPHPGFKYQIPYRALVPQKIDNMLVAGRCISCDHIALGSLRVMPQCFIEGDAAGTAAAMCLKNGCAPKDVEIRALQEKLRQAGAIIGDEDIVDQPFPAGEPNYHK